MSDSKGTDRSAFRPGQVMRPARRQIRTTLLVVVALLLALGLLAYVLALRGGRLRLLDEIQRLSVELGRPVTIGELQLSPWRLRASALRLSTSDRDVIEIGALSARLDPLRLLVGERRPESLEIDDLRAQLSFPPEPGQLLHRLASRLLARQKGAPGPVAQGATNDRAWPPVLLREARLTALGPNGESIASVSIRRALLRQDGEELGLEAEGRFAEGLGQLSGTDWRLDAHLRGGAKPSWRARLAFARPVSLPTSALPFPALARAGYGRLGAQALEIDSAGHIRALGIELERARDTESQAFELRLGEIELEIPGGLDAALSSLARLPRKLADGRLTARRLSVVAPQLQTRVDLDELSLRFGAALPEGELPPVARIEVIHPVLRSESEALASWLATVDDPRLLLRRVLRDTEDHEATDAPSPQAPPSSRESLAKLSRWLGGAELSLVGGEAHLAPSSRPGPLRLDAIELFLEPAGALRRASGSVRWRPVDSEPVQLSVEAEIGADGSLRPRHLLLEGAWLRALRPILPAEIELTEGAGGSLSVSLGDSPRASGLLRDDELEQPGDRVLRGDFDVGGLGFDHRKIARLPVRDLRLKSGYTLLWRPARDELALKLIGLSAGHAKADVSLHLRRLRSSPAAAIAITLPRQPCDHLLRDLPAALVPRLEGARLEGEIEFALSADVDPADPYAFAFQLKGDWSTCRAATLGPHIDVERLGQSFTHRIWEAGQPTDIRVGPGTDSYVPLEQIPEYVWQAALATEDMAFFKHQGFRTTLMTRAIRLNMERGRYVYGGSTISQQLVKNLFLSREKTISRKVEEAFITWHMERTLTKNRILELYLNCIEYGPGIYGIRRAAYTYFGVHPSALTPLEAAFLMGLKPDPKSGYSVYRRRVLRSWWRDKLQHILRRLWKDMGVLTESQYRAAAPYVPTFHYPGEGRVRPEASGLDEESFEPPPDMPPMPPRSEGRH